MGHQPKIVGPGKGFDLAVVEFFVLNGIGTATVAGDIVAMIPVATTGILTSYRVPVTADFRGFSWLGVAMENIPIGGYGRIRFRGQCKAFTLSTGAATAIVAGKPYAAKAGSVLDIDTPAAFPRKYYALAMEEDATASATKALRLVMFDGIDGFGTAWTS